SVARRPLLSNGFVEPNEASLPRLEDATRKPLAREVELGHGIAVELDAALRDQPSGLARRQAEGAGKNCRQMNRVARWERKVRHLLGRLSFAHDAREVLLSRARRVLAVRPRDDETRERELRVERLAVRHGLLCDEPPPLLELRIGDPHRPP